MTEMRQSHRLIWNSFAIWTMRIFRLVPELYLLPFVIHRLGESSYGIFYLAWSIFPILGLFQNGIGSSLVKYAAGAFEKKDYEQVNRLLCSSCMMLWIFGTVSAAAIISTVHFYPQVFEVFGKDNVEELKFSCTVVALMIMATFPLMPFAGILHSLQRYDLFSMINTVFAYLRIGAIVAWFLLISESLEALVVISAVNFFVLNLLFVVLAFRMVPSLRFRFGFCNLNSMKMQLNFGLMIFLTSACLLVNTTGVNWLMAALVSPAFVGLLAIIVKPSVLMKEIIQAMSLSIMPATSRYAVLDDQRTLQQLYIRGTRYMTLIGITTFMGVMVLAKSVLGVWMGEEYQYLSAYAIVLYAGTATWMSTSGGAHMLNGMGRLRMSFTSIFTGSVVVSLSVILLFHYAVGSSFWAVVTGLTSGYFVTAFLRHWYCMRIFNLKGLRTLWAMYGQALSVAGPIILVLLFLMRKGVFDTIGSSLVASFAAVTVFGAIFSILYFTASENELFFGSLKTLRKRYLRS